MVVRAFPPVESADEHGLLAVGGDLEPETLLLAYSSGIFPWPWDESTPLLWFSPPMRGVLFFDDFHVPRRVVRDLRRREWTFSLDRCTPQVIEACAGSPHRRRGSQTWITAGMTAAYQRMAELGHCHSSETWAGETLAGGLYGLSIGGMFAGESMFYRESGASKAALMFLVEWLRAQGVGWMDCQQVTPLLAQFGAREVPRCEFLALVKEAIARPAIRFSDD